MLLGLRIDVDTFDGSRFGVPRLLEILGRHGARGTFYFSLGPDNAGRAVLRLCDPEFRRKMRRTRARSVYGWRTVLSGTLLPARVIERAVLDLVLRTEAAGHEAGVHAWDHRRWQDALPRLPDDAIAADLDRAHAAFERVARHVPRTFAAPAWLCNDASLLHQERFQLAYASDCRGREPFLPLVAGRTLATPQVPATLPTLDECLGETCGDDREFFDAILATLRAAPFPVLTVHAELEGGPYAEGFARFLAAARGAGVECVPLGAVLAERRARGRLEARAIVPRPVPGRHGVVSTQS